MRHSLSTSDIKLNNRRLVLDAIFQAGTTSRTQLAKELSMSKPAISDNLASLLACGVVREAGESGAGPSGGRKQILLKFNPANRYIISIDLSSNSVVFALSDLVGTILNTFEIFVSDTTSAESCLDLLCSGVRVLQQASPDSAAQIYCIAVAAPGSYDSSGSLLSCNIKCGCPPWYRIDLKAQLSEVFHLPVIICNNIKAATLGEYISGACVQQPNMLFLSTGLGIGVGILLEGRIFSGESCDSGEVYDYLDSEHTDRKTNFEDRVCLEYLKECCSELNPSPFPDSETPTLPQIVQAYQDQNDGVCKIISSICRRLAGMIYNQLNFISIHTVCFAGEYTPFYDCFAEQLKKLYSASSRPLPSIYKTELAKFGSISGMIYLARQQYFSDLCSRQQNEHD